MAKLVVNTDQCLGCGMCFNSNDKYFEMNDEGLSVCKKEQIDSEDENNVQSVADSCPAGAITVEEE